MSGSLRELSRRCCGRLGGRKLAPGGREAAGPGRPVAVLALALLCVAPVLSAREKEVQARWEELAPLVERRDVETVLTNGVYVRGRAEKVLPGALEVRVKKTSDAAVIPKGLTRIPREQVTVLTVRWKQGPARFLLPPAMYIGGGYLLIGLCVALGIDTDELASPAGYAAVIGFTTAGYLLGARIDSKRVRVVVVPGAPPARGEQGQEQM